MDSSNINRTFSQAQRFPRKTKQQLGGIPVTVTMYRCLSKCFLSVMITVREQVVLSTVAQRIVVKFLTNEIVKSAEILTRHRAQFDNETLSMSHTYDD
jgi:hypothetical protein